MCVFSIFCFCFLFVFMAVVWRQFFFFSCKVWCLSEVDDLPARLAVGNATPALRRRQGTDTGGKRSPAAGEVGYCNGAMKRLLYVESVYILVRTVIVLKYLVPWYYYSRTFKCVQSMIICLS